MIRAYHERAALIPQASDVIRGYHERAALILETSDPHSTVTRDSPASDLARCEVSIIFCYQISSILIFFC